MGRGEGAEGRTQRARWSLMEPYGALWDLDVLPQVGGWVWGLGFIWPPKWVGGYGVWGFLC